MPAIRTRPIFALLVLCAVSLVPARASNLFTNGSFETNPGGACTPAAVTGFVDLSPGSNCLTGWTVVSGTVDYVSSTRWDAENGTFSVDMNGFANGAIEQTIATIQGATYDVTFWLAGNFGAAPLLKSLEVAADGASQDYTFNATGKSARNMGYVEHTFEFTATGSSATVEFLSIDNPSSSGGPVLDNVSVDLVATPEPGSVALVVVGISALAVYRFRRA